MEKIIKVRETEERRLEPPFDDGSDEEETGAFAGGR